MKKKFNYFYAPIEKGVLKNLFIVSNYLAKKHDYVSHNYNFKKKFRSKFDKSINFIIYSSKYWDNRKEI